MELGPRGRYDVVMLATSRPPKPWRDEPRAREPMLATLADTPLDSPRLVYEPKYDGIRTLVTIERASGGTPPVVTLRSRQGNVKNVQFPELVEAFVRLASRMKASLVLDGEVVALDESDGPASFLRIQGRLHLTSPSDVERTMRIQPVAFYGFDILRDDDEDVRTLPFIDRRRRLERRLRRTGSKLLRITESVLGGGVAMHARAEAEGWEGLVAKDPRSTYASGRRSQAWRKIKLTRQQPFVVGGWTAPRGSRVHFGALLLGVYDGRRLVYVGQTGSGFTHADLERLADTLAPLETTACPFDPPLRSGTGAHWVEPTLVAEVKYTEWTMDGKLRHPIYQGLSDVAAANVTLKRDAPRAKVTGPSRSSPRRAKTRKTKRRPPRVPTLETTPELQLVIDQLHTLEDRRANGTIQLPDPDERLKVTNLHKPFWPELDITKGDLLRYYARISPFLLPAVADRPLVMKRFPDGIHGNAFYQQRRVREAPPAGVRVEPLPDDIEPISEKAGGRPDRFIGGSLLTLLYMAQMAAISQDPWFSKVGSLEHADQVAIDLDPMDGVPFGRILDVARWVRDELELLETPGFPKTSGSRGLHIYVPLPPGTSYESGMLFCQIVATVIATRHPKVATVTRMVSARGGDTVYVDYLQNILGKTLATAYSVRASDYAGVSTPLSWQEIDDGVEPRDFTIRTAPARFEATGDLWSALRTSPPADPRRAFRYSELIDGASRTHRTPRSRR